jgi:hypothetical protein
MGMSGYGSGLFLEPHDARGGPWCSGLTPLVKPRWVRCKLGKTIEQPCSDVLVHTLEVCKGTRLYNGYLAIKDDHDS